MDHLAIIETRKQVKNKAKAPDQQNLAGKSPPAWKYFREHVADIHHALLKTCVRCSGDEGFQDFDSIA
jgi:hypothetical protein